MNLISPGVLVTYCKLLQFTGYMICSTTINIPISVVAITSLDRACDLAMLLVVVVVAVPTPWSFMPDLLTNLALDFLLG